MPVSATACLVVFNVFLVLAAFSVALRLWSRAIKHAQIQLNDYAIVIALVLAIGLVVALNMSVTVGGAGQHTQDLSSDAITFLYKVNITLSRDIIIVSVLWVSTNSAVKISIAQFYVQLFPHRVIQVIAHCITWLVAAFWVATVMSALLICRPLAFNWDATVAGGTCGDLHGFWIATIAIGLVFDIILVVLPMPMLWGLQLKVQRKIALTFVFGLGAFICIITILRLSTTEQLSFVDLSYNVGENLIWTSLEPLLAITNACLPMMPPVFSKVSTAVASLSKSGGAAQDAERNHLWAAAESKSPRFGSSQASKFKRLQDHLYPLSDVQATENEVTVVGNEERDSSYVVFAASVVPEPVDPSTAITATTHWIVHAHHEVEASS
ncbi:hypothetical protein MMC18_005838 [Xylographa bjoerkii]|nr:hypothetical protein [Xylographa bjoerkii]